MINLKKDNVDVVNGGMRRFCVKCGSEFYTDSKSAKYCGKCKEENKKELLLKQKEYAKTRSEKLNLTSISIYKDTKDILKTKASQQDMTMAEYLKSIIG